MTAPPHQPAATDAAEELAQHLQGESRPITVTRAPGRLDVIGGIADYTGSLVCTAPLDRATAVALAPRTDRTLHITNLRPCDPRDSTTFTIPLDDLATHSLADLHARFKQSTAGKSDHWAAYIAGCLYLLHEKSLIDLRPPTHRGVDLWILGHVPPGGGVSSSAALEVASMMNLAAHYLTKHKPLDPLTLSVLCQEVENRVVGAPCGIMDQISSCLGHTSKLVRLLCQPHDVQQPLALPAGTRVVGINSKVKHSVGGGQYGLTRCAAFMGHRIILHHMTPAEKSAGDPLRGYLANLPAADYDHRFRNHLPTEMDGRSFLEQFGPTIDRATQIDPATQYHIRAATDHHVYEAQRTARFAAALDAANTADPSARTNHLRTAGQQMYASHDSYGNNARLGAEECDLLVNLARQHESAGLYGARITGGGSGGTVAILCDQSPTADAAISDILKKYSAETGHDADLFAGTSPGAWDWGVRKLGGTR